LISIRVAAVFERIGNAGWCGPGSVAIACAPSQTPLPEECRRAAAATSEKARRDSDADPERVRDQRKPRLSHELDRLASQRPCGPLSALLGREAASRSEDSD